MTLDTTQRVLFAIPTPKTELTIGQCLSNPRTDSANQTVTPEYSGVSAYTAADIRLNAMGTWTDARMHSDLIAQSKGQLWIQALNKVVGLAGADLLLSSPSSTMIAGQGGVTILAGFRPGPIEVEPEAGTFPSAVDSYDTTSKIPTMVWGILDTVYAVGLTALDAYLTAVDNPGKGIGWDAWGMVGAAANLAGAGINIAGLSGSKDVTLPGINMFSQAGVLMGTPMGSVNLVGVPGLLIASTFTTQFALIASSVRGLFSCGMTALKSADVTALYDLTIRSSNEMVLASRTGDTTARGPTMTIGTATPKPGTPQLPTRTMKLHAFKEVALESKLETALEGQFGIRWKAGTETTIDGGKQVRFKTGSFEISLLSGAAALGGKLAAQVELTQSGAKVSGPGGVAKAELSATAIDLAAGAGHCKFDLAAKKLTVDGTTFDIK